MRRVYLDHNATSPMRPEVTSALEWAIQRVRGNASSLHLEGRTARALLEEARERIADALDAHPQEVIFTSGGTESNNAAVMGLAFSTGNPAKTAISAVEHPSVYEIKDLPGPFEDTVRVIPVSSDGLVQLEALQELLEVEAVRVVCVMHANNETGVIQPIDRIAKLCESYGALLHVDAVQSVGKVPFSFRNLGAATAAISGHKLKGPPGIGLLLVREGVKLRPFVVGGPQERGLRAGTEAVPLAWALAQAVELATGELSERSASMQALRDGFEKEVLRRHPGARVNGAAAPRVPNTSNIAFPGYDAQALVMALDVEGVAASTGSACSSGAATPSHVLLAMGLSEAEARSCVRFSLGPETTKEDVEFALEKLTVVLRRLAG